MLQRVESKFCLKECKNMVTYWAKNTNTNVTDKIADSLKANNNGTGIRKRDHDDEEEDIRIRIRIGSTVSATKSRGAIRCLHDKEERELNAAEDWMSFKRSNKRKVSKGNGNAMKKNQDLKNTNYVYSSENAGDKKKMSSCSPLTHVHPKLPDYDDLVAKFSYLKNDKTMRSSSFRAHHNLFLR